MFLFIKNILCVYTLSMKFFITLMLLSNYLLADNHDQIDDQATPKPQVIKNPEVPPETESKEDKQEEKADNHDQIDDQATPKPQVIKNPEVPPETESKEDKQEEKVETEDSPSEEYKNDEKLELNILNDPLVAEKKVIKTSETKTPNSPYKLITFLIIGLFSISLFINYLLLKWRSKYKNQLVTFPENLIDQFESLGKDFSIIKSGVRSEFEKYTEQMQRQVMLNQNTSKDITLKYEEILESFSLLQKSLDNKDREIERLKKGYDLQILKKYISKLIRVMDTCDAINQDPNITEETKNEVTFILDSLNDLLEDIGIKKYSIDEGVSTKSEEFGLPPANEWVKFETDNEDELFKVKRTLKDGYFIDAENKEVMKYAKIEVFVKGEKNE